MRYTTPVLFAIIGLWTSTQKFAHSMNGDPRIVGEPLLLFFGHPLYNPVYYFLSMFKFVAYEQFTPYYLSSIMYFLYFGILALLIAMSWTLIINYITKRDGNDQGTARFATKKDLKKRGLLKKEGIVCGQLNTAKINANQEEDGSLKMKLKHKAPLICHPGKLSTLLLAPTGAAKGVGVIIPTILNFPDSMIIFDPKGENYKITSRYRSTMSTVVKFAPTEWDTIRYNPVMEMREGIEYAFRDSDMMADILFAPAKGEGDENSQYFTQSGKSFVTAALLHIRYSDYPNKSLGGVRDFFAGGNVEELEKLMAGGKGQEASGALGQSQVNEMMNTKHFFIITEEIYKRRKNYFDQQKLKIGDRWYSKELQDMVLKGASDIMQTNAKEKASVWKTIATKIRSFDDPCIRNATSGNDFSVMDFINTDKPITLYLCVPYSELDRIKSVFRLIITSILKRLTEGETSYGNQRLPFNILFLLDEFPTLGAFPIIAEQMGVLRGYGCFFLIVCQALNQLVDRYGQNHPFLDHCPVQIIYAPGKTEDAEVFSRAIGNETVHQTKLSRSGGLKIASDNNINYSDNEMSRALLDAADIKRIPGDQSLIMVHGMQPYIAKKVVYYADPRFKWKIQLGDGLNMKELYSEAACLPSQKKIREDVAERKRIDSITIQQLCEDESRPYVQEELYGNDEIEELIEKCLESFVEESKDNNSLKITETTFIFNDELNAANSVPAENNTTDNFEDSSESGGLYDNF